MGGSKRKERSRIMAEFHVALCQHRVRDSVEENLKPPASESVRKAARQGADIVVLPEMFLCHFVPAQMRSCAQTMQGSFTETLAETAAAAGVWLIGGSFPEIAPAEDIPDKSEPDLYNTCPVFAPDGELKGFYRKRFLFDVDIPGKVKSCESAVFSPGNRSFVADAGFVKFGVAICFDIRFPQIFIDMAKEGAENRLRAGSFRAYGTGSLEIAEQSAGSRCADFCGRHRYRGG